ncbi:MAG: arginine--tRNA ligase [Alphaproteobacteria bacterium]
MSVFKEYLSIIKIQLEIMSGVGELPAGLDFNRVSVEPPREAAHGDISTNAAMVLAKPAQTNPRALAAALAARLGRAEGVVSAEVAGPGFINLRLTPCVWRAELGRTLEAGEHYGDTKHGMGKAPINVEYVSANPTGPLHVGHARGAVIGDALAALLEKAGYTVLREYYINDAGAQIDKLAFSTFARYLEALGEVLTEDSFAARFPGMTWEYRGEYLAPVGAALAQSHGAALRSAPPESWLPVVRDFAVAAMMTLIKDDLAALGIRHDVFTSERAIVAAGKVDEALAELEGAGHIYTGVLEPPKGMVLEDWEPRPQTLFRASAFGDDVDRPLKKSDGGWTYFAADIAYHLDKARRGYLDQIDVWGADHGGYVKRMKAAVSALTAGKGMLDVKLCQLVNLLERGQPVRMSKRAGNFVTLREVVDEVGKDVVRFMMLTRKNDAPLDFDLAKATEQSLDNPVFYVQYAHARAYSAARHAKEAFPDLDVSLGALRGADLSRLDHQGELDLIRSISGWPRQVEMAADAHEPHRLAFFLFELVAAFHSHWSRGNAEPNLRFVVPGDRGLTLARLALARGVATVIASGLKVFGVAPVEELR